MARLRGKRARRWAGALWPVARALLRLTIASWRIRLVGNTAALDPRASRSPTIYAFWHGDLIACGSALHRHLVRKGTRVSALASRSGDGDLVARAAADFGFSTIRGSTSRGGLAALRAMRVALVKDRSHVVIAPDGPRGPAHRAKAGAVQLAAVTGAPIVPMVARVGWGWRAGSWDRMVVPCPLSRIVVAVGDELRFERGGSTEERAARLDARLAGLETQAGRSTASRG